MQFHLPVHPHMPPLERLEQALRGVDPAALLDLAPAEAQLRVSTSLGVWELLDAIGRAGYALAREQVVAVRASCCGGCGG